MSNLYGDTQEQDKIFDEIEYNEFSGNVDSADDTNLNNDIKLIASANDDEHLDYRFVDLVQFDSDDNRNSLNNCEINPQFDSKRKCPKRTKESQTLSNVTSSQFAISASPNSEFDDSSDDEILPKKKSKSMSSTVKLNAKNCQNVALPQFTITGSLLSENDDDEIGIDLNTGDIIDISQRQKVKTMDISAVKLIGADSNSTNLNNLNKFCAAPTADGTSTIFKCKHCPKAFATPYHLMIHTRKSHVCQHCLAAFEKPTDLYKHIKDKHNTFECLICSRIFKSNSNLRQHMRKTHEVFLPAHVSLLNVEENSESN